MNDYNRALLRALLHAINQFGHAEIGIDDITHRLAVTRDLLERQPDDDLQSAIREAEADVELIQFTVAADEQRPAVDTILKTLRLLIIQLPSGA